MKEDENDRRVMRITLTYEKLSAFTGKIIIYYAGC